MAGPVAYSTCTHTMHGACMHDPAIHMDGSVATQPPSRPSRHHLMGGALPPERPPPHILHHNGRWLQGGGGGVGRGVGGGGAVLGVKGLKNPGTLMCEPLGRRNPKSQPPIPKPRGSGEASPPREGQPHDKMAAVA